jgi:hypothetical protein
MLILNSLKAVQYNSSDDYFLGKGTAEDENNPCDSSMCSSDLTHKFGLPQALRTRQITGDILPSFAREATGDKEAEVFEIVAPIFFNLG